VKFVLIDPKKVELTLYSKIERHYLAKLPDSEEAIITDTKKVIRTLNSLNIEMDNRYDLLRDAQVRNIKEYNDKFVARKLNPQEGHHFLTDIVLVIDEFADLMMIAANEIEAIKAVVLDIDESYETKGVIEFVLLDQRLEATAMDRFGLDVAENLGVVGMAAEIARDLGYGLLLQKRFIVLRVERLPVDRLGFGDEGVAGEAHGVIGFPSGVFIRCRP
jgi:hypothetical protein